MAVKPTETQNGKPVHARNAKGTPVCGAKKKNGELCMSVATIANGRCKTHGGMSPGGIDHYAYKGGRQSVVLQMIPANLRKAAEASLASDDQTDLSPEIAILDANTYRLLENLKKQGDAGIFDRMAGCMSRLEALTSEKNEEIDPWEIRREFERLQQVVANGHNQEVVWEQVQANAEMRRRLTETDQKRRFSLSKVLEAKHVDTLILAILTIIRKNVTEVKVRAAIGREILSLVMPKEASVVTVAEDEMNAEQEGTAVPALEPGEDE